MRLWAWAGVCVVAAVSVLGQFEDTETNTRLGLLATQLGLPPVPGAPSNPNLGSGRQDNLQCDCLPINQVCPFNEHGVRVAEDINVRIVNKRPLQDGQCPETHPVRCCTAIGGPGNGGVSNAKCGGRSPLSPYRQAQPPEADFGEYPWMAVVLGSNNNYLGGGALIRNRFVLTAAHRITSRNIKVRLGDYDLSRPVDDPRFPHQEVSVANIIIHPNFNSTTLQNDVAILQLARPINVNSYPHIGLGCLPRQGQKFEGHKACFVSGWGRDSPSGQFQNILKEVDLPIVESFTCQHRLRNTRLGEHYIFDNFSFLCAGGIEGKDACTGDGGAPLVCPTPQGYTVVGLVAWGIGCAEQDVPGVYVNVANYANFIESHVGPL